MRVSDMEWINVKDKPLEIETVKVLAMVDSKRVIGEKKFGIFFVLEWIDDAPIEYFESFDQLIEWLQTRLTHWMPIPESPKE